MKQSKYTFEHIEKCEMCGDISTRHKVLGQRLNQSQGLSPKSKSGISVSVMKCRNCELIYAQPQPIPNDIQDHYGIPPESYWHDEYFVVNENYFSGELNIVKKLLPFSKNMKALDIGAGLGKCMLVLDREGFDAYGFEPSKPFYERAIGKMGISEKKLKLGMIENMEYEENSFDFITFGAVFEHLYHPAESLEKSLKWLKPNGVIHIEVPSSKHLIAKLINLYYKLRGTNYVTHLSPMHTPFHLYEFDLKSFEKLGEKLGFKVEKIEYLVCELFFVPRILHYPFRKYMELTNTGLQIAVYLRKI